MLASSDHQVLAGHRRETAVLFCDLRGFTSFTKQMESEELMAVLDEYYRAAENVITTFNGILRSLARPGQTALRLV